jgi:hypothetical protein
LNLAREGFSEVGTGLLRGASCTLPGKRRIRRPVESGEARIVFEDPPPTNNGVPEEAPAKTSTFCSTSPNSR